MQSERPPSTRAIATGREPAATALHAGDAAASDAGARS